MLARTANRLDNDGIAGGGERPVCLQFWSPWAAAPNGAGERGWCAEARLNGRKSDSDRMSEKRTGKSKLTSASAPVDARLLYRDSADPGMPEARGLYDPALAKDSCGVGFIADIKGRKSHRIVEDALTILVNLEPAQVLRPQGQGARHHTAGARRVRHRCAFHAA
jgi:hypothetical protein